LSAAGLLSLDDDDPDEDPDEDPGEDDEDEDPEEDDDEDVEESLDDLSPVGLLWLAEVLESGVPFFA